MRHKKTRLIAHAAMIAAIYVILTWLFAPFGFGEVQIRISEALTILPAFTPAAVPGLFIGCLIGNILSGAILPDIMLRSCVLLVFCVYGRYITFAPLCERYSSYLANRSVPL